MHVCRRSKWLNLPIELLLTVLDLLDQLDLMTARLVCQDWRKAAISFLTHLNLNNCWFTLAALECSNMPQDALAKCLQSLPNVSHLAYRMTSPDGAFLLSNPTCSRLLKDFYLDFHLLRDQRPIPTVWSGFPADHMTCRMEPINSVTGLTWFGAAAPADAVRLVDPHLHGQSMASSFQLCIDASCCAQSC